MDLFSASVYELRGELRKLHREFLPTAISAMKRSEVIHHIEAYKKLMEYLKEIPLMEKGSGKLPPRPISNVLQEEGEEIVYSIPQFPAPRTLKAGENKISKE